MQNALLILGNVAAKMSATLPLPSSAGVGHFDRHQSELQLGVLILASGKMAQAKTKWSICPQRHRQIVGHVILGIKFAFFNLDFPNVAALGAVTFPLAGVGHFNRRQLEREIDVLVLSNAILLLTRLRLAQFDSILHFCNFSECNGPILHYRHIFALLAGLTVY